MLMNAFPKEAYKSIPRKPEGWALIKPRPNPYAKVEARKMLKQDFVKEVLFDPVYNYEYITMLKTTHFFRILTKYTERVLL
jgi:hypothetical protein